jgi:virginiamycin B lyase
MCIRDVPDRRPGREAGSFSPAAKKALTMVVRTFAGALAAGMLAAAVHAEEEVEFSDVPDGARPHDVSPAPDGKVWYTAQGQGALGILDPVTGEVEQVPLGDGSAPHGVITGPDGKAWITDGGQNAIVSFDGAGTLWFTGQNGIYGRLDPGSGKMQVFDAPKGRGPYGITSTPDGEIYYASLAGSYVGQVDAATGAVTVIEPPTPDQGARRVWSDSKGNIWVSEWNSGQVSRYAPESRSWQSWRLPGDNPKTYALFVDGRDIVWLSDFGANAVVRFDPTTETFTSFEGSAPEANVRQILGRPGEVWAPESGTDRLMLIRTAGE